MPDELPATTGPGIEGFIAAALWRVYVHFPSAGQNDWFLLFIALALAGQLGFQPLFWRALERDVRGIQRGLSPARGGAEVWIGWWNAVWLIALLYFFHTMAGQTFLDGRRVDGSDLTRPLDPASYRRWVGVALWASCAVLAIPWIAEHLPPLSAETTGRASRHRWTRADLLVPVVLLLADRRWTAASVVLMSTFVLATLPAEIIRVTCLKILIVRFGHVKDASKAPPKIPSVDSIDDVPKDVVSSRGKSGLRKDRPSDKPPSFNPPRMKT